MDRRKRQKKNNMAQQTYGEWMRSNPPIPNLTAVEWCVNELLFIQSLKEGEITESNKAILTTSTIKQAKQMEKEQIEGAYIKGGVFQFDKDKEAEQYYNKTYNK